MGGSEGRASRRPRAAVLTPAIAAFAAIALWPATASAGNGANYASPAGSGSACTEAEPCDILTASVTADFEQDIRLESGTYELGSDRLIIDNQNDVFPDDPGGSVTISATGGTAYSVRVLDEDSSIRDVSIVGTNDDALLLIDGTGTPTAERVFVSNSGVADSDLAEESGDACEIQGGLLRDSVCWGDGTAPDGTIADGDSDGISMFIAGRDVSAKLRNVTAYSTAGSGLYMGSFSATVGLDARNTTFLGGQSDIQAFGSGITADIDFSNYSAVVVRWRSW